MRLSIVDGWPFKVSTDPIRYARPIWQRIRTTVTVIGRHLLDLTGRCESSPPDGDQIVVVTGHGRRAGTPRRPLSSSTTSAAGSR
jgi:hypothetical protein